jgi:PEP-CTERM motif
VSLTSPTIATTPGGTVILGSGTNLTDSALLSGGMNPTGTITFTLMSPSATVVDTETVPVVGNGMYQTIAGYTPVVTGMFEWQASYSGDANNLMVTSPAGEEPEVVTLAVSVPEPGSLALCGFGFAVLGFLRRRRAA